MALEYEYQLHLPDSLSWFAPRLHPLARAVYLTLVYADIFEYPLRLSEIHRRLIGIRISPSALEEFLSGVEIGQDSLIQQDGLYALPGREEIFSTRKKRAVLATRLWPSAIRYGQIIARLPFVRMVAVTGALAVNNVAERSDLDYLIVTEPGYLWTCRAWSIALVRLAALQGVELCPNYFISKNALSFQEKTLYTAHELIQMAPLSGQPCYEEIRRQNAWSAQYLPNAAGPPKNNTPAPGPQRNILEWIEIPFQNRIGTRFEEWEMNRKIRKFSRMNGHTAESAFSTEFCKGHFDQHGRQALVAFYARLKELEPTL